MIEDCTALILAGGDSRRMGFDKTALTLDGQTLLQRAIERMQAVFPRVLVSVRQPRADVDVPQVFDAFPDAGPLAGLCAGLAEAKTGWVFAVAADMPFVSPALVEQLAARREGFEAVVPVVGGCPQPLAAFYAVAALPSLRATLAGPGKHSLRAALERLLVCRVDEKSLLAADPELASFVDLDTPADVAVARNNQRKEIL
ncbi:molybdenum cofactor guanylyltransferase [Propionivibrio limicola]|uniref:molybdenum cofactor guanylyltransferase n=1 Tax=Propionivibrio limicola TaxID=167645 RepID=UPI001291D1E3|nr:molybdenum cofactor guanylyltransferase [Propionivibrio limicola]